jgi:hypothetical protein
VLAFRWRSRRRARHCPARRRALAQEQVRPGEGILGTQSWVLSPAHAPSASGCASYTAAGRWRGSGSAVKPSATGWRSMERRETPTQIVRSNRKPKNRGVGTLRAGVAWGISSSFFCAQQRVQDRHARTTTP